jgi:hypothetical protein
VIQNWLNGETEIPTTAGSEPIGYKLKCPDVPNLPSGKFPAPSVFWEKFPVRDLPRSPTSPINVSGFCDMLRELKDKLSPQELWKAEAVMHDLSEGAVAPLSKVLPPIKVPNSPTVAVHGQVFKDTVAWWIRQGYVAGPFKTPPLLGFRSNSMIAVEQKGKVRPIMNLSAPEGDSYNDAVIEDRLDTVVMSSARQFGYTMVECGKGARMWKLDWTDAYKNIPVAMSQLQYQGFHWSGMFFVETQLVFGSKPAVATFDRLGGTVETFACVQTQFPRGNVHRTLDDLPFVTPANSTMGPKFLEAYREICDRLGVKLAPLCPNKDKAFEDSTKGTVLGIIFDSTTMVWSISEEKAKRILHRIRPLTCGEPAQLLQMQRLMGALNDFSQMCPFLNGFRQPLCDYLVLIETGGDGPHEVPSQVKKDLRVWAGAVISATKGLPIPCRPREPSIHALEFTSDAAGAQFTRVQGRFIPVPNQDSRGAACLGHSRRDGVWFCSRITWPPALMLTARDSKDHAYGCKSPTLEAVGVLLPFVTVPHLLKGKEVVMHTDNEAIVYGWESRRMKNDESAAILIRAIHVISAYLECLVHVVHLPRMSSEMAVLADSLTRESTSGPAEISAIEGAVSGPIPEALTSWLSDPTEDWGLVDRLLELVQNYIKEESEGK